MRSNRLDRYNKKIKQYLNKIYKNYEGDVYLDTIWEIVKCLDRKDQMQTLGFTLMMYEEKKLK
jgi:hypothetical protein